MSKHIETERWLLELRDDGNLEISGFGDGVYVLTTQEMLELRNALVAVAEKYTLSQIEKALLENLYAGEGGVSFLTIEKWFGNGKADKTVNDLFRRGLIVGDKDARLFITRDGKAALDSYRKAYR